MENLYYEKGGKEQSFNCCNVRLNEEDLDRLCQDIKGKKFDKAVIHRDNFVKLCQQDWRCQP